MTEWIDVPVAEVAVGDEVKVADGHNGFSKSLGKSTKGGFGFGFFGVSELATNWVELRISPAGAPEWIVPRSSIVAVRRRKPERCQARYLKIETQCQRDLGHTGEHQHQNARGRVEWSESEPQPKPGDWWCRKSDGTLSECMWGGHREFCGNGAEVYRASGWSKDTRTGQPWVVKSGDPIVIHVEAESQNACHALRKAADLAYQGSYASPNQLDDYKRIGLDVRPVERRKR